ncbi:uncharacterized protein LOC133482342 [Phyllopteryx taeniolatus]|uniref:uncharacterized protein LOC133482342 n=1 Tax=Phyllopteryx taeniolatus TaxID=161469 RepID=UPI002AD2176C|nr:uncharacterized protein LOC133482342 [Phyllopteryx taeniolatus]
MWHRCRKALLYTVCFYYKHVRLVVAVCFHWRKRIVAVKRQEPIAAFTVSPDSASDDDDTTSKRSRLTDCFIVVSSDNNWCCISGSRSVYTTMGTAKDSLPKASCCRKKIRSPATAQHSFLSELLHQNPMNHRQHLVASLNSHDHDMRTCTSTQVEHMQFYSAVAILDFKMHNVLYTQHIIKVVCPRTAQKAQTLIPLAHLSTDHPSQVPDTHMFSTPLWMPVEPQSR